MNNLSINPQYEDSKRTVSNNEHCFGDGYIPDYLSYERISYRNETSLVDRWKYHILKDIVCWYFGNELFWLNSPRSLRWHLAHLRFLMT